jgi:hypothetical protein
MADDATLRFDEKREVFFLVNFVPFLLLPGLVFHCLLDLNIKPRVAVQWMWLFPGAYCFAFQAGGTANDAFAVTYFLSALAFSFEAQRQQRISWYVLSVFAAALLTGAKTSNIPLLLPIAVTWLPLLRLVLRRWTAAITGVPFALPASALPQLCLNYWNTSDWAGDRLNTLQLKSGNPLAGLVGDFLEFAVNTLQPGVLLIPTSDAESR